MKVKKKHLRAKIRLKYVDLPDMGRDYAVLDGNTNNIIYLDRDGAMSIEHVGTEEAKEFKLELYRRQQQHKRAAS